MKRILPLLVVSILVLSGLGAVAVPDEIESLNIQEDWALEIVVEGWWLGYKVTIGTVVNESVTGDYIINITTNASIMIAGRERGYDLINLTLDEPEFPIIPHLKPVIGFGLATINISVVFTHENDEEYPFEAEVKGFVFLFYVLCSKTTFNIP